MKKALAGFLSIASLGLLLNCSSPEIWDPSAVGEGGLENRANLAIAISQDTSGLYILPPSSSVAVDLSSSSDSTNQGTSSSNNGGFSTPIEVSSGNATSSTTTPISSATTPSSSSVVIPPSSSSVALPSSSSVVPAEAADIPSQGSGTKTSLKAGTYAAKLSSECTQLTISCNNDGPISGTADGAALTGSHYASTKVSKASFELVLTTKCDEIKCY